jgi:tellurite resistance protein
VSDQEHAGETDDLPLPTDFTPTDDHKERARELNVDLADALEDFHLWAKSEGVTSRSWNARFTQFMKRRAKFAEQDAASPRRSSTDGTGKRTTSDKVRDGIALAERLAAEEAAENVVHLRQIEGA